MSTASTQQLKFLFNILNIVVAGLELAPELKLSYDKASAKLKELIDEDRDPTPEEWAIINDELAALNLELNS